MKQQRRRPRPHKNRPARPPGLKDLFRQPEQDFYRLPDLEVRDGRIYTDGCRRVLDFTPQKLCLDLGAAIVTFYGDALRIESFSGRRLAVGGRVARIEFAAKWGDGNGTL